MSASSSIDLDETPIKHESIVKEDSSTEIPPSVYSIKPSVHDTFKTTKVKAIIEQVLSETLTGKKYNETDAKEWTKTIADDISTQVKELGMKRYKHVAQVMLGSQLGAGCKFIARCRWDAECDNQVTDVFTNASLFCVVTVFGTYHY